MSEINFDDFFEPEEESDEDFDFIDPSTLRQFQRTNVPIEKIQKEIFNFEEKDDEIYGEKATRNFEFQIQVNRILQIFDEMVKKIQTLLCIQEFVKDRKLMEKYFSDSDIDSLLKYCPGTLFEVELKDENTTENVSRLIQLLLNSDLHLHADGYKDNLTAPKELKKEQILHQMWKKYEKTKEKMATLRENGIYRKMNFEEKMRDKYETIERYKQEIELLRNQNEIEIQNQIKDSNVNIIEFCQLKDSAIELKYDVAQEAKEMYKQFLNENLTREKKLREHKEKAIQAFQAILQKYDVDVGEERTRELDELRSALEMQRKEFSVWQETVCAPQVKLHAQLMLEKEEAERVEQSKELMIFMMNRSAKILQKYWRNMVAKRKKKKGRRGGKKK